MAITFVSANNVGAGAAQTSVTVTKPTGLSNGDLLLWAIGSSTASPSAPTPIAGWTSAEAWFPSGGSPAAGITVWYRFVDGSEGSTFAKTGLTSGRWASIVVAYRGVDQTTPFDTADTTNTSTTTHPNHTSITTVTANALVLGWEDGSTDSGVTNLTYSSSNLTIDTNCQISSTAGAATNALLGVGSTVKATAGAITPVMTPSGNINRGVALSMVLRPGGATLNADAAETTTTAPTAAADLTRGGAAAVSTAGTPAAAGQLARGAEVAASSLLVTNLLPNPSGESATSPFGWVSGNINTAAGRTAAEARTGTYSTVASIVDSSGGTEAWTVTPTGNGGRAAVTAGMAYTGSAWVKETVGAAGFAGSATMRIRWFNSSNTAFANSSVGSAVSTSTTYQRVSLTVTAPAGAVTAALEVRVANMNTTGDSVAVDDAMLTEGSTLYDYFDGASSGASWSGTAHESSSSFTFLNSQALTAATTTGQLERGAAAAETTTTSPAADTTLTRNAAAAQTATANATATADVTAGGATLNADAAETTTTAAATTADLTRAADAAEATSATPASAAVLVRVVDTSPSTAAQATTTADLTRGAAAAATTTAGASASADIQGHQTADASGTAVAAASATSTLTRGAAAAQATATSATTTATVVAPVLADAAETTTAAATASAAREILPATTHTTTTAASATATVTRGAAAVAVAEAIITAAASALHGVPVIGRISASEGASPYGGREQKHAYAASSSSTGYDARETP